MIPNTAGPQPANRLRNGLDLSVFLVASLKNDCIELGSNVVKPRVANAVQHMSNGYVANVAAVPANASEQNATAEGLEVTL